MQKFLPLILAVAACGGGPGKSTTTPPPETKPVVTTVENRVPTRARRAAADARPIVRASGSTAACGKLPTTIDADGQLLADRLRLRVPGGTGELARAYDIMSSPKPAAEETRLMLGGGKSAGKAPGDQAFVVFAKELWQLDPDVAKAEADAIVKPSSLADEAPKFLTAIFGGASGVDVEEVLVGDGSIRAFAARPKKIGAERGADAALVLALLLSLPDATLSTVEFYVTPDLAGVAGCVDLAERAAATLGLGARKLERAAAVRELGRAGGKQLAMAFPEDYTFVHQRGPDFDIYKVYRLRPLSLYPGHIDIAVDMHPSREQPDQAVDEKGTLLGKPMVWHARRTPRGGVMVGTSAAISKGPDVFVQVSIVATRQEKFLDEFKRVAETLVLR